MTRICIHVFNHRVKLTAILDIFHMFTHANIIWLGCTAIVVLVAACTGSAIYTSGLQRTTVRVMSSHNQVSSVVPVSMDKSKIRCI